MDFCQLIKEYGMGKEIAHVYRENKMSYQQLNEKSDALAVYLIEKFGKAKTPIVVYGHKENNMLVCFFACIKSGHAYIPVDASTPLDRIKNILEISNTSMILNVCEEEIKFDGVVSIGNASIEAIILEYHNILPEETYRVKGEDIHYIIYTSGSTGKPKGVKITSNCLESFINWTAGFQDFFDGKHYTFMNQAPFSFDLSVMDLYLSLYTGSTLYSIDKEMIGSLKQLFNYYRSSEIDVWVSTPSFAEMCLADSSFNSELLPKLKLMLFCGETLTNNCVKKLHERFAGLKVVNLYGPTEATVAVTAVEVTRELCEDKNPLPVGYVKQECKIVIVKEIDENVVDTYEIEQEILEFNNKKFNILKPGNKGEIVIVGKSVSPGYLNNEEVTKSVFTKVLSDGIEERYYRTGDEGYLEENLLFYCGRIDFQVKLNGYRVELEDIESNLMAIDFVESAVVIPIMKHEKLYYLAAAITLNKSFEEKNFTIGLMVKDNLKKLLPEYMVPRKIIIKDMLPMTPNGKINRKLLMEELNDTL